MSFFFTPSALIAWNLWYFSKSSMAASKLSTLVEIASSLRLRLSSSLDVFSRKFFVIWWSSHKKSTLFWILFPYLVAYLVSDYLLPYLVSDYVFYQNYTPNKKVQ